MNRDSSAAGIHPEPNEKLILPNWQRRESPLHGEIVWVRISRHEVESMATSGIVNLFSLLTITPDEVFRNAQRVLLTFDGYDDDSREVFEIKEVQMFIKEVAARFPGWLILIYPAIYIVWFSCLVDIVKMIRMDNGVYKVEYPPNGLESAVSASMAMSVELLLDEEMNPEDAETLKFNLAIAVERYLDEQFVLESDPLNRQMMRQKGQ